MALGRSITKKSSKYGFSSDKSERRSSISKIQISSPVELISTTNMISYTSPSLRCSMSNSSMSSNGSPTSRSFPSSPSSPCSPSSGEETDLSSAEDSYTPKHNHLSTYFSPSTVPSPPPRRSHSTKSSASSSSRKHLPTIDTAPAPLNRSPSRNKSSPPSALHSSSSRSGRPSRSNSNPFGAELAKVAEIAEEMGTDIRNAEEEFMYLHGLRKFSAMDYTSEIGGVFEDELPVMCAGWI